MSTTLNYPEQVWTIEALKEAWMRARLSGVDWLEFRENTDMTTGRAGRFFGSWEVMRNSMYYSELTLSGTRRQHSAQGFEAISAALRHRQYGLLADNQDIPW